MKSTCGQRPTSVYGSPPLPTYGPSWFALESRIMFDGAGEATLSAVTTEPLTQSQAEASLSADDATSSDTPPAAAPTGEPQFNSNDQALFAALAAYDTSAARQEIVFLSPSVRDYQQLLDGISPNVEVFVLDPARDGVEQMAEVLAGRTGIDAVHLIAEGNEAQLHLGTSFLTQDSISTHYAEQFQQIGQSLSEKADLLIYGCNFGQGEAGLGAMKTLADLTGADIAASTGRTGHVSEFANWELEVSTGFIQTSVLIGEATQAAWEGVMATFTVTTTTDGGAGSLRQAIIDANANSGTDTITFVGSGTYLLTITGAGENAAATGDLDITGDLILIGNGVGSTVIDASGFGGTPDRVFHLIGTSTATISGITIQGGDQSNGGGIFVDNTSTLNLSDATLTGNNNSGAGVAGSGGAIHVHGTANLDGVLLSGNTANDGGAIGFHGAVGGSLTNVTISGNTTTGNGGGLWNDSTITVTNSTITGNSANADTGGGIHNQGTLTLIDTAISGNSAVWGGGISSNDTMTLQRVTIDANMSSNNGGGIYNDFANSATLTNVTISGNTSGGNGGGIFTNSSINITNSTIASNLGGGGIHEIGSGDAILKNTILDNNTGGNANRALTSLGNNIDSDSTAGLGDPLDGMDPLLGALADNGGPTKTHALLAGSPAIDAGANLNAPAVDGQGFHRVDGRNDIGAFESGALMLDKIYWVDQTNDKIQRSNLDGTNIEDVLTAADGVNSPTEILVDAVGGKMYWSEYFAGNIRRANLDGTNIETLYSGLSSPAGMAFDKANNTLYWTENPLLLGTNQIRRADMDGGGPIDNLVTTGTNDPVDLQLDLEAGKIYWTDGNNGEILRANLDGTGVVVFLSGLTRPQGLRLDVSARMIYWASDGIGTNKIQRANMDGPIIVQDLVTTGLTSPIGVELDLSAGKIYWSDWGTDKIQQSNLDGSNVTDIITTGLNLPIGIALGVSVANSVPTLDLDANNSSGATGNDYQFTFTEGDAATAIADSDTDLVDVDSTTFDHVTLAVSGLLDGNAETLVLDGDTFALATAVAGQNTTGGNYHVVITTGAGTAALTITKQGGGTFSEIETETLIEAIQYRHTDTSAPTDGDRLIDVTVNDGALDSAAARTTINVNPMNDAPVVTVPGAALSATEQVGLAIHGTGFSVSDVDAGGGSATATLNVGEGALTVVAGTSGVTIVAGNGTGTVMLSGTIAQINNLLTGGGTGTITYLNGLNAPSASTTLTVTVNDQGNTGADPGLTGTGTTEEGTNSVTINLSAVNDDPTNVGSLPTDVTVTEDVLSNVDLSLIDLSDVDAGGGNLTVTLTTATGGNLTAVSGGGVTVAGSGTGVLTLTGIHANLNTYLNSAANVQYLHGTANTNGNNADTITVQVSDNGNTGSGGGGTIALGTVNVDITAQNDAPTITALADQTIPEDGTTGALAFSVSDVETAAGSLTVTAVSSNTTILPNGNLTLVDLGGGNWTIAPTPALNQTGGPVTITVTVSDGTTSTNETFDVTVTAQNDAPVISSNGGGATAVVNVAENQAAATTITSVDVDGGVPMYSIVGGADATLFTLHATTGALTFNNAPDFEAPLDAGPNNVYEVTVQVADGSGGTDIQALSIVVTDVNEGLPPPPPIPPSLVPQPPAPPSGAGPLPAGSPPSSPVVVPAPVSPKPNSEVPFVPVPPGNDPDGTALLSSEMPGAPQPKGLNTPASSIQFMREIRGYVEEGVAPRMYQADKEVPRAFGGQTLEKMSTGLSEAFRTSLGVVEEDLRRATDMSESSLKFAVGVTNLGGVSLTAGVIAWLLRSGALLASLAATLPAWRHFDPLPVVLTSDRTRRRSTADTVVAADRENKQFRGLRDLLDKKGDKGRSEGEDREG